MGSSADSGTAALNTPVYRTGFTLKLMGGIVLFYAAVGVLVAGLVLLTSRYRTGGGFFITFIQPAAVLWGIFSIFLVPVALVAVRRGTITFYDDRIERRKGGETKTFTYMEIEDPDLAGLTTINEGALGYMPGASASLPTYNYVPYISFSIDGVKLRFTVRARTRDGRQFRDFIAEKILPKGEDGD